MADIQPYSAAHYVLPGEPEIALRLTTPDDAEALGGALAGIDPWLRFGTGRERMTAFLEHADGNKRGFTILHGGERAGVVAVRSPWLAGPYLNLLAVLPAWQGKGLGRAALRWFEAEARLSGARNGFLCVSAFNAAARGFYQRSGYTDAAMLEDLIMDGEDEILMRKRLW